MLANPSYASNVTASSAVQLGPGYYAVVFSVPAGLAPGKYPFGIAVNGGASQGSVFLTVGP